jgi:cyclophilin family peptidyl-prolyl cis-trans isomerase
VQRRAVPSRDAARDNYTPTPPNRPAMELIQAGINPTRQWRPFPNQTRAHVGDGLKHVAGTVSMARGTGADTATSDFSSCSTTNRHSISAEAIRR